MAKEPIKTRNRKISRYISDAYVNVIRPEIIKPEHWDMWLKHNAGLTQIELAMIFRKPKFEVVQILAAVVEQLKNKPLIVEKDWSQEFTHWTAAQEFRDKVRRKFKAVKGTNEIFIMSEV